jgi:hypothetical protein
MDHSVDKSFGDTTFSVAYGKRAAALFPAVVFLFTFLFIREWYVRWFFMACIAMFGVTAVFPSEKPARCFFLSMFAGSVIAVGVWLGTRIR